MKFLDLLRRPRTARTPAPRAPSAAPLDTRIATIIDDALAAAGLGRDAANDRGIAAVIDDALTRAGLRGPAAAPDTQPAQVRPQPDVTPPARPDARESTGQAQGRFLSRTFAGPAGTLAYKLYVPVGYDVDASRRLPLVVMLHGCTQSPDDFAAGTRMNALADHHGLLVAYPAQSANANGSKCWNWFRPQDQGRDLGEPALIAGIVAQVAADHRVDPARIYVAGLSAGGAMAVVLGRTYPEVFAAVGVHSGLPYRAAHDVGSAFAAMQRGAAQAAPAGTDARMPTIVFHGDRDHTVALANGAAIVAYATGDEHGAPLARDEDTRSVDGGHRYTRTDYRDASGRSVVEDWRVQGGGHAWMGGSPTGTYTDPQGPDASTEMLRFFLQHAK